MIRRDGAARGLCALTTQTTTLTLGETTQIPTSAVHERVLEAIHAHHTTATYFFGLTSGRTRSGKNRSGRPQAVGWSCHSRRSSSRHGLPRRPARGRLDVRVRNRAGLETPCNYMLSFSLTKTLLRKTVFCKSPARWHGARANVSFGTRPSCLRTARRVGVETQSRRKYGFHGPRPLARSVRAIPDLIPR